jgi:hypothetical protein
VLQEAGRPALSRRHVNAANPHQGCGEIRPGKVDDDDPPQTYGGRWSCGEGGAGPGDVGRPKVLCKPSPKLLEMSKTKSD